MKSQLKAGAVLSYLQMGLGTIIGLIYTPLMIGLLGKSEYGLYNTVSSAISMLSVLNLGFNSSYIRYYTKYRKTEDEYAIWRLNGLFLLIFLFLGMVAFVCGLFLSFNLDLVFANGLTSTEYEIARVLMLLLTVNLAVSFPMSVFSNIISAHERYVFLRLVGMLKTVLGPFVTLPLLLLGFRSIALVTVSLCISLTADAAYIYYALHVMKNRFVFHNFEKGLFADLFSYTFFIALNSVIDQLNWNVDKVVIGRYRGTGEVAFYSVGYTLSSYYMIFSTAISGVFTPQIHRFISQGNDAKVERSFLTDLFIKVGRAQYLVLGLVASGFVLFGREFIEVYWAGSEYTTSYYVGALLILPLTIPLIQNMGIEIQRAQNLHRFRGCAYLVMAILNLFISIYLCQPYGAVGSAVGTALSLVIANGFIMNIYYHKRCHIDIIKFWRSIARLSVALLPPLAFGCILRYCFQYRGPWHFLLSIGLYSVVYCVSMWKFGMNETEKGMARGILQKLKIQKRI